MLDRYKVLTICQPYATLIVTNQEELPPRHTQKRTENRTWETRYRGPLLIHAGLSPKYLATYRHVAELGHLPVGVIVGVAEFVECVPITRIGGSMDPADCSMPEQFRERYSWIPRHPHAEGPFCFVLQHACRFDDPIPLTGRQGLFEVTSPKQIEAIDAAIERSGFLAARTL